MEDIEPKALDPRNVSNKTKQTLFDYALWHAQHEWVAQLGESGFGPARGLMDRLLFAGAAPRGAHAAGATRSGRLHPPRNLTRR